VSLSESICAHVRREKEITSYIPRCGNNEEASTKYLVGLNVSITSLFSHVFFTHHKDVPSQLGCTGLEQLLDGDPNCRDAQGCAQPRQKRPFIREMVSRRANFKKKKSEKKYFVFGHVQQVPSCVVQDQVGKVVCDGHAYCASHGSRVKKRKQQG